MHDAIASWVMHFLAYEYRWACTPPFYDVIHITLHQWGPDGTTPDSSYTPHYFYDKTVL
jgi:hypothetical protein